MSQPDLGTIITALHDSEINVSATQMVGTDPKQPFAAANWSVKRRVGAPTFTRQASKSYEQRFRRAQGVTLPLNADNRRLYEALESVSVATARALRSR